MPKTMKSKPAHKHSSSALLKRLAKAKLSAAAKADAAVFLQDVLWGDYESTTEAMAAAVRDLQPDLTPEQWKALIEVLKVVLPYMLALL